MCCVIWKAMLVIALAVQVLPVFISKNQLDTYATELCREAEISGRVGSETSRRAAVLTEQTGLSPRISWPVRVGGSGNPVCLLGVHADSPIIHLVCSWNVRKKSG